MAAFRKAIETCENLDSANATKVYGEAPAIISLAYSGWLLCIQGRFNEGLESGERAIELARQCGNPLVTAFATDIHCNVLTELRRPAACLELAEEQRRFTREHLLVFWEAGAMIKGGWARAHVTDPAAGIKQLRSGIEDWKKTGAALHLPTWNCRLAEALLLADDTDEAATVLQSWLAAAYRSGETFMLAELHRFRGRVHHRLLRAAEAEADFLRAREVARQQQATLFELRATSDLAQLRAIKATPKRLLRFSPRFSMPFRNALRPRISSRRGICSNAFRDVDFQIDTSQCAR